MELDEVTQNTIDNLDVEYEITVKVDGEPVRTLGSVDYDEVVSLRNYDLLQEALQQYARDLLE